MVDTGQGQRVPIKDALLAIAVAVIWGMNFTVIDEGLGDLPPTLFVALRFVVVVFPAVFLIARPKVPWRTLATVGLFLSVGQFGLLYTALSVGMPAGLASLVLQSQVLFTVALAALRLHERPSRRQVIGTVIGAFGLAVVASGRSACCSASAPDCPGPPATSPAAGPGSPPASR
jgi:O-acetylserine/cysteine efflux transporter